MSRENEPPAADVCLQKAREFARPAGAKNEETRTRRLGEVIAKLGTGGRQREPDRR